MNHSDTGGKCTFFLESKFDKEMSLWRRGDSLLLAEKGVRGGWAQERCRDQVWGGRDRKEGGPMSAVCKSLPGPSLGSPVTTDWVQAWAFWLLLWGSSLPS